MRIDIVFLRSFNETVFNAISGLVGTIMELTVKFDGNAAKTRLEPNVFQIPLQKQNPQQTLLKKTRGRGGQT